MVNMELVILISKKIRWCTIRMAIGITAILLFLLAGISGASPPPAILKIDGNEQTSGIGSSCWKEKNETYSLCSDYAGTVTPAEPLLTRSPFTAYLRMPLQEPPEELYFSTFRVNDDELKEYANGGVWSLKGNAINRYKRHLEREPEFNFSLATGLYVFKVGAEWKDKGTVTYGFLVQVNDPEAGKASASPLPAILEINGNQQTSGIGNNCWKAENETPMLCADTFSIITPRQPLLTGSPFTAHLRLPLQELPDELGFSVTQVMDKNESYEARNDFFRAWNFNINEENWRNLLSERESDINLTLPSGLYVFNVFAKWEGKGDVSYGFLVKVSNLQEEDTTQTAEKATGFQFALAISILLAIYASGQKTR